MIRHLLPPVFTATLMLFAATALAQSAHVHGEGRVNIAIEGNQLSMMLESPGADIVGFEHEAHSTAEKEAISQALALLEDPVQVLGLPANAECRLEHAHAMLEGEDDEHEEHSGHKEHDEDAEHDDDHDEHDESHASFIAEYKFNCTNMEALDSIEFSFFRQFANAQSLDIVMIDTNGQRRVEIDRQNPILLLE